MVAGRVTVEAGAVTVTAVSISYGSQKQALISHTSRSGDNSGVACSNSRGDSLNGFGSSSEGCRCSDNFLVSSLDRLKPDKYESGRKL